MTKKGFIAKIPECSLVHLCTLIISRYLVRGTWRNEPWYNNLHEENPFRCFPSQVIEELVKWVYPENSVHRDFQTRRYGVPLIEMLRPLCLSGRIEHFELYLEKNNLNEVKEIINLLCFKADRLKSLKLSVKESPLQKYHHSFLNESIITLIHAAENLQFLSTDIYFDLRILKNLKNLHSIKLSVSSRIPNVIQDENMMNKIRLIYVSSMSLEHGSVKTTDIAFLISNLPQLQFIQWDIAEALIKIHGKEEISQITKRYEIKRAYLLPFRKADTDIFVQTCPLVERLKLFLRNYDKEDIYDSLSKMDNIVHLSIVHGYGTSMYYPKLMSDSFRYTLSKLNEHYRLAMNTTVVPVLSSIKCHLLKVLKINFGVEKFNFDLLGSLCPNLQILKLNIISDVEPSKPLQEYFLKLKELYVHFNGDRYCNDNLVLLTSSPMLNTLLFTRAKRLTDDILLRYLLQKNRLSNLEALTLKNCGLTEEGLLYMLYHCPKITEVKFSSPHCTSNCKQFEKKIYQINRRLKVTVMSPENSFAYE